MTKAQRIEAYIKECFETNCINIKEFFSNICEGKAYDICWTDKNGKIDMEIVSYASELLGISIDDILTRNDEAQAKWWRRYPYVWHKKAFDEAYKRTFFGDGYDIMRLYEVIFDTKTDAPYPTRYDYQDVKKRLFNELKEIDKSLPGTYHEGAHLTNLMIDTDNFCEFEEIEEMTLSFIEMMKNAKALLLKAVHQDLTPEEAMEFNFLSTSLGVRDRYYVRGYLRYNDLVAIRDLYSEINEDNFDDYVIFRKADNFKPWCCVGFVKNRELVEKYLEVVPQAKGLMRQFADDVSQFYCTFVWSDAKPIEPDEIELEYGITYDEEEAPKERTSLYVQKTKEELNGADSISDSLRAYCRPAKLGGIPVKIAKNSAERSLKHITHLMKLIHHNNLVEWRISRQSLSGGGANE